jgi:class 3 adenylate cyclase/tetratricopeptide (TPR) repeat protein
MNFSQVLHAAIGLLVIEGRLSYRRLQAEFGLNDAQLDALRFELTEVKGLAVDQDGAILVWAGDGGTMVDGAYRPALAPKPPFRLAEPTPQAGAAQTTAPRLLEAPPAAEPIASDAERRPLTVMFCDLADSTALSTELDPEDLQDVIRAYRERCTGIIREYEGFVAKYMGDGILVYFGYPQSLERNAERAIRTGLAIVEAMAGLNADLGLAKGAEIAVRIGIATGLVIVGEIVGEGLAQERTVIGEAPNVAARLQGLAGRNGVVTGALTKEIAGDAFVYEDLGAHELKGLVGLVKAWGVTGLRADRVDEEADQAETDAGGALPVLIGRDEETGLLRRAWQSTKDEGRGQVVLISGEAGIGKSVLVEGLRVEVRAEELPGIVFRCSPYHTNSALYPVIEHVKRLLRWQPGDTAAARLGALERTLGNYSQPVAEVVPLFASLLSLPLPEARYPPLALSPQQLKQQIQDALIAWILEEAERQPLLEVSEDLQWADPSTLEVLGLLIEQAPTAALLMVLTFRPDFVPTWPARSHITPITLNRLERTHTEALVARVAGTKPLPAEVVNHIVAKTDGVPLYVEELTKTIMASDILHDMGDRFELTGPLASLSIPQTLQGSLMARLDRLPQAREIAQLGSVLGREFAYQMLSGLSAINEATLQEGLRQLVEAELLYQRGRPPRARYTFKHALLQDAAYESLLRRTRHQYHRKVAELLERRFPDIAERDPELVAHHFTQAAMPAKALPFWKTAAQRALKASAMVEAAGHLEAALDVLGTMPEDRTHDEQECEIQMLLGPTKLATKGYTYPPLEETYNRALDLCTRLNRPVDRIKVMRGLQLYQVVGGRLAQALGLAEQMAELIEDLDEPAFRVGAAQVVGQTNFFLGNFSAALQTLEKGIAIYDPDQPKIPNWPGGEPGSQCRLYAAFILWMRGHPETALTHCEAAIAIANREENKFSLASTLAFVTLVRALDRDMDEAGDLADRGVALCEEQSNGFYLQFNRIIRGWTRLETGASLACVEEMQQGLSAFRKSGARIFVPHFLAMQAEGLAKAGKPDQGLGAIEEALALIETTGERCWEADIHRIKGDLIGSLAPARPADSEDCYRTAIRVARDQGARSWELRAATALARRWQEEGRTEQAHDLLAPIYGSFAEGFDNADLKAAKTLLSEIASSAVVEVAR